MPNLICYNLVLEDDTAIRIDATRILAYLSNNRGSLMEQILGNYTIITTTNTNRLWLPGSSNNTHNTTNNTNITQETEENTIKALKEIDIFRDGFSKLVPNSEGKYEIFLRGATDDNESEENRFADFSFWISDNNIKCDKIFIAIDNALQWILLNNTEIEEIRKQLEYNSINHNNINSLNAIQYNNIMKNNKESNKENNNIDAIKYAQAASERLQRTELCLKQHDHIIHMLQRFEIFIKHDFSNSPFAKFTI